VVRNGLIGSRREETLFRVGTSLANLGKVLDGSLARAERAVLRNDTSAMRSGLEHVARYAVQIAPPSPMSICPAVPEGPWVRIVRCAFAYAFATGAWPQRLEVPSRTLCLALLRRSLQVDLLKMLPVLPGRMTELLGRLPEPLQPAGPMLRALYVERCASSV